MAGTRHFHRRRQRQFCRSAMLWTLSILAAALSFAGWREAASSRATEPHTPAFLYNPDAGDDPSLAAPRVNGDGVLATPRTVAGLIPAIVIEAADAVSRGDLARASRGFVRWLFSAEALHSSTFWVFWSTIGAGVIALLCWSMVYHLIERHHPSHALPSAAAPGPTDGADSTTSTR